MRRHAHVPLPLDTLSVVARFLSHVEFFRLLTAVGNADNVCERLQGVAVTILDRAWRQSPKLKQIPSARALARFPFLASSMALHSCEFGFFVKSSVQLRDPALLAALAQRILLNKSLFSLALARAEFDERGVDLVCNAIAKHGAVEQVMLGSCPAGNLHALLERCPSVTDFELRQCPNVDAAQLARALARCTTVQSVTLSKCGLCQAAESALVSAFDAQSTCLRLSIDERSFAKPETSIEVE